MTMTKHIEPDADLIAAYEEMLSRKDQADIEYEADCKKTTDSEMVAANYGIWVKSAAKYESDPADKSAVKAGFRYRVYHASIGEPLYCKTIEQVCHVIRTMYPTLNRIGVRKLAGN
jgi:hypothetical protein